MTDQQMTPETQVLIDYANENLQLKIENARLRQRIAELETDRADPNEDITPAAG